MTRPLLGLMPASQHVEAVRTSITSAPASRSLSGPILQYWDRWPPRQIRRIIKWNCRYCTSRKIPYVFFSHKEVEKFLSSMGEIFSEAYAVAPHPAVKSDIFRLCYIAEHGGYYLDADMVMRENFSDIFGYSNDAGLILQWTSHGRINCPNWFFGFHEGNPLCRMLAEETARSIISANLRGGREEILRNVLEISGPGLFTRIVGTYLADCPPGDRPAVMTVTDAYLRIQNGPEFLGKPLSYKSTEKHWAIAAKWISAKGIAADARRAPPPGERGGRAPALQPLPGAPDV